MAGTLTILSRTLVFGGKFTQDPDLTTAAETIAISKAQTYTDGSSADQANQPWSDEIELAATSGNLDLAGGLTDAFGNTITYTSVKELMIHNTSTTAGQDITISGTFMDNNLLGGGSSTVILGPSGVFMVASPIDGFTVTAGSGDILTVDSGANTITYEIFILGVVA